MEDWGEKFKALPTTRIKVINEGGHYTVQFDFRKFGKRNFRKVEESVIEKLYKIEHDRNCYQRNLIFGCKIFPEYVDELRDAFDKAYDQYLSDGNIQPFANIINSYKPKSNERRGYLVPKESAAIFSLHDYCMISEDDVCCKFLDELLPNLTNLKAEPVGGGAFSKIGRWMFYTYDIDFPKNTMIFCDVGFHNNAPFDSYICHKYCEWSRWNCYADTPDSIREKKIRQLIKEYDLYFDMFIRKE